MVLGGDIFGPDLAGTVRSEAVRKGWSWRDIRSQAGHGAYPRALFCPTAMIITPCEREISHNNAEDCAPEDFSAGQNVLLHAAASRADR